MMQAVLKSSAAAGSPLNAGQVEALRAGPVTISGDGISVNVPGVGTVTVGKDGINVPGVGDISPGPGPDPGAESVLTPSGAGPIPVPWPNFTPTPISIPIPIPQFSAMPVSIPLPTPEFRPVPFAVPFPLAAFSLAGNSVSDFLKALAADITACQQQSERDALAKVTTLVTDAETPAPGVRGIQASVATTVDAWVSAVRVTGGTLSSGIGLLPPGGFVSGTSFRDCLHAELVNNSVAGMLQQPFADALGQAWDEWFGGYVCALFYPEGMVANAGYVSPSPNTPVPLSSGFSANADSMSSNSIVNALTTALGSAASQTDIANTIRQIARWFTARFEVWTRSTAIVGVLGSGTAVPSMAGLVPVGYVINGTLSSGTPVFGYGGVFPVLKGRNVFEIPYL